MAAGIGSYRDRVRILTRSLAAADGMGEEVESWPDPGAGNNEHWCRREQPAGGEAPQVPRQLTANLTIRFRKVVTIAAVDRVIVLPEGDVYAVVGTWRERAEDGGWQTLAALSGTY
jgi:head-tail adaptor